jgi:hypothetical protein
MNLFTPKGPCCQPSVWSAFRFGHMNLLSWTAVQVRQYSIEEQSPGRTQSGARSRQYFYSGRQDLLASPGRIGTPTTAAYLHFHMIDPHEQPSCASCSKPRALGGALKCKALRCPTHTRAPPSVRLDGISLDPDQTQGLPLYHNEMTCGLL